MPALIALATTDITPSEDAAMGESIVKAKAVFLAAVKSQETAITAMKRVSLLKSKHRGNSSYCL